MNYQNTNSEIPKELKKWNWGAFFLNWIWGIGNKTYISFLVLIPIFNFVFVFILGAKGNEWAWKNKKWDNVDHFKSVQKKWAFWGILFFSINIVLLFIVLFYLFSSNPESAFQMAKQQNTIGAYSTFIEEYPEHPLSKTAYIFREKLYYENAVRANSIDSISIFIRNHSESSYLNEAIAIRDSLIIINFSELDSLLIYIAKNQTSPLSESLFRLNFQKFKSFLLIDIPNNNFVTNTKETILINQIGEILIVSGYKVFNEEETTKAVSYLKNLLENDSTAIVKLDCDKRAPISKFLELVNLLLENNITRIAIKLPYYSIEKVYDISSDELTEKPKILHKEKPIYPGLAKLAGIKGKVVVTVIIDKEGNIEYTEINKSIPILDDVAITAAQKYRFSPAKINEKPVKSRLNIPFVFN